jgi:hypothetical protein
MPKILPVIGALLTIAAAIGWNVVRYPVVWEMVGPAVDFSPSASAAAPLVTSQPAQVEQENSALPSTPKTNPKLPVAAIEPPSPPVLADAKDDAPAPVEQEKRGAGWQPAPQDVRRLPPLDAEVPSPPNFNTAEYPLGAIPIYPQTGF